VRIVATASGCSDPRREELKKSCRKGILVAACFVVLVVSLVLLLMVFDYLKPAELQVDLNRPRFRLVRQRMILPDQVFEMDWTRISRDEFPPDAGPPTYGQRVSGGRYSWVIMEPLGGERVEDIYDYPEDNVVYRMDTRSMFKPEFRLKPAEAWATNH